MQLNNAQLLEIVEQLQYGVEIKDRVYRLKTYANCFLGDEAVRWLISSGQATNPTEAIALGNKLIRAGLLQHVTGEHSFKDEPYFYRLLHPGEGAPYREKAEGGAFAAVARAVRGVEDRDGGLIWQLADIQRRVSSLEAGADVAAERHMEGHMEHHMGAMLQTLTQQCMRLERQQGFQAARAGRVELLLVVQALAFLVIPLLILLPASPALRLPASATLNLAPSAAPNLPASASPNLAPSATLLLVHLVLAGALLAASLYIAKLGHAATQQDVTFGGGHVSHPHIAKTLGTDEGFDAARTEPSVSQRSPRGLEGDNISQTLDTLGEGFSGKPSSPSNLRQGQGSNYEARGFGKGLLRRVAGGSANPKGARGKALGVGVPAPHPKASPRPQGDAEGFPASAPPDISQFEGWPDRPVLFRMHPSLMTRIVPPEEPQLPNPTVPPGPALGYADADLAGGLGSDADMAHVNTDLAGAIGLDGADLAHANADLAGALGLDADVAHSNADLAGDLRLDADMAHSGPATTPRKHRHAGTHTGAYKGARPAAEAAKSRLGLEEQKSTADTAKPGLDLCDRVRSLKPSSRGGRVDAEDLAAGVDEDRANEDAPPGTLVGLHSRANEGAPPGALVGLQSQALPSRIRVNVADSVGFESGLFVGRAALWIAGLASAPEGLFEGRQRKTCLVVQGRFKKQVPFDDLVTGQQFFRPLVGLPAPWLLSGLIRIARSLSPSLVIGNLDAPRLLSPVVATASCIHVALPDQAPPMDAVPNEDMHCVTSFGEKANSLTSTARKRWFASAANRKGLSFDTEHVWTFHFWQHLLDCASFQLDMGIGRFDLRNHLDGQPLQLMAATRGGDYAWAFELWHEDLL